MFKKIVMLFFIVSTLSTAHAETCPSVMDMHNQNLKGWKAFDIENGTLLSAERLKAYTQSIQKLALVEWMEDAPEGAAHCYYNGAIADGNYLNAFLAKELLLPDHWEDKHVNVMQCDPSINECHFMEK